MGGNPQTASLTTYYFGGAYEVTDGAVKKYYAFGGGTVAMRDGNGLQYFLTDHLGSVLAVTDASGTLISEQRYLPFGEVRTDVGEITQTDFGYTFQRGNSYIKLLDYKARWYHPGLGRFISPDSIIPNPGNPQAINRYAYSLNNPLYYTDPSGHFAIAPFLITAAVVVGVWLIAAPPAYAPSSDSDLAARVTAAESNPSYQLAEWIDEHPLEYAVLITVAVYVGAEALGGLAEAFNNHTDPPLNDQGEPYPQVIDPRTGEPIPFPADSQWKPSDERTPRSSSYRDDYMKEWAERGYPEPDGGWDNTKIHHTKPLEYGGDNSFDNGVPLTQSEHDQFTRWWRGGYHKPR